jgi:hypothetical protein
MNKILCACDIVKEFLTLHMLQTMFSLHIFTFKIVLTQQVLEPRDTVVDSINGILWLQPSGDIHHLRTSDVSNCMKKRATQILVTTF